MLTSDLSARPAEAAAQQAARDALLRGLVASGALQPDSQTGESQDALRLRGIAHKLHAGEAV